MKMAPSLLSLENPVMEAFVMYSVLVIIKTIAMSLLTVVRRTVHNVSVPRIDPRSYKTFYFL